MNDIQPGILIIPAVEADNDSKMPPPLPPKTVEPVDDLNVPPRPPKMKIFN